MGVLLTFAVGATIGVYGVHYYRNLKGSDVEQASIIAAPMTQTAASNSSPEAEPKSIATASKKASSKVAKEDRLNNISGIGPTYAKRLREAGIVTISQLAETSAETLQSIVAPTPKTPRPDVEPWLKQASELASN